MVVQQCECTSCNQTVHLKTIKMVNLCFVYFTTVKKKKKRKCECTSRNQPVHLKIIKMVNLCFVYFTTVKKKKKREKSHHK